MADKRKEKRTPITLKIKFKSGSLDQFVERYSVDVSQGGIFIRTKDPLPIGTKLRFEFQLQDASSLITGEGSVVWVRKPDTTHTGVAAPGMGVHFDKLTGPSQQVLERILNEKKIRGDVLESRYEAGMKAQTASSKDNGDNGNPEPFQTNVRHAFQGECVAFVKAAKAGTLRLSASAPGLAGGSLKLKAVKGTILAQ